MILPFDWKPSEVLFFVGEYICINFLVNNLEKYIIFQNNYWMYLRRWLPSHMGSTILADIKKKKKKIKLTFGVSMTIVAWGMGIYIFRYLFHYFHPSNLFGWGNHTMLEGSLNTKERESDMKDKVTLYVYLLYSFCIS